MHRETEEKTPHTLIVQYYSQVLAVFCNLQDRLTKP